MKPASLVRYAIRVEPLADGQPISSATGFLYEHRLTGSMFLITNWHVVSGRDSFDNKHLLSNKVMPTQLRVHVVACQVERKILERTETSSKEQERRTLFTEPHVFELDLYKNTDEGVRMPTWKEHPSLGRLCDVVALDFQKEYTDLTTTLNPSHSYSIPSTSKEVFNEPCNRVDDMEMLFANTERFDIDSDVTVVGFPNLRIAPPKIVPVLKTGIVASLPETGLYLDRQDKLPAYYLDILTRPGFSGSPVFWVSKGVLFKKEDEVIVLSKLDVGPRYKFLGIYSSRTLDKDTKEPIYGLCWTMDAIDAVCRNPITVQINPAIESSKEGD